MFRSFGGHPIFGSSFNKPSRLTKSNALVKSMKAMHRGWCCSLHFSCNCLKEKTMSVVDLSARNPHCDSGYTLSAIFWSLIRTTRAKHFPTMDMREMPLWLLQSDLSPLFLYRVTITLSFMSWGTFPSFQHWWRRSSKWVARGPFAALISSAEIPSFPGAFRFSHSRSIFFTSK